MKLSAYFLLVVAISFWTSADSLTVISGGDSLSAGTEIAAVSDASDQSQFLLLDSIKSQKHYHFFYNNYKGGLEDFDGFGIYRGGADCEMHKTDSIIAMAFSFDGCAMSPHTSGGGWISVRRAFVDIQNFGKYKGVEMEYRLLYRGKARNPATLRLTICDIGASREEDKRVLTEWKNKGYDYMWWSKDITLDITKDRINHNNKSYEFSGQEWQKVKFPFSSFETPPDLEGIRLRGGKLDLWRITAYEVNLVGCGIEGCFIFKNVRAYK